MTLRKCAYLAYLGAKNVLCQMLATNALKAMNLLGATTKLLIANAKSASNLNAKPALAQQPVVYADLDFSTQ
jgi:hypothetical protein